MKKICIFGTASKQYIMGLIKDSHKQNCDITLVIPQKNVKDYRDLNKLRIIINKGDFIDYMCLKGNKQLSDKHYDEVYVLSSQKDNFYQFCDCYCVISEMSYSKMIWVGSNGERIIQDNGLLEKTERCAQYLIVSFVYKIAEIRCAITDFIMGYRW